MEIWPGAPYPLGATYDGAGTNFSVFSEVAQQIDLCLFDEDGHETRIPLPEVHAHCWHGYVPGVCPGQRYGFRVHGPFDPTQGHQCRPEKLSLDPYAKAIEGDVKWDPAVYNYQRIGGPPDAHLQDSAPFVPRSIVINPYFDWDYDRPPRHKLNESVIYEMHVKGFTALHPQIPENIRGTYAGLAHPAAIEHLKKLGITAVELMPIHHFIHHERLVEAGKRNYWGYDSIGYFAPYSEYSSRTDPGGQVQEFKQMVKALHEADIEVILDVVYNHTGEGDHLGPNLSLRGLDNAAYYRLQNERKDLYEDFTGCGNSLNMRQPHVLQMIMDSLRYWIQEMHVDGFRFDLASALARELHAVDRLSAFFDLIQQDPVVRQVKLIAEPWDIGDGGYQVGNFPPLWSEWNGRYRDEMRDFWRGAHGTLPAFAGRFTGSSDLYESTGRKPHASINFITCHDGFTLRDLVSYEQKHNYDNGEDNRDGESHNRSWNCGVEGHTDQPEIRRLRSQQQRNLLTTLFLSQGVPLMLSGDEIGRTQRGNNNPYCQDSPLTWIDWQAADEPLLRFVQQLIALRAKHPIFQRRRWFRGHQLPNADLKDISWHRPDGAEMQEHDWHNSQARALGIFLNGNAQLGKDRYGRPVHDDSFYLLMNGHPDSLNFEMPQILGSFQWQQILDSARLGSEFETFDARPSSMVPLAERSIVLLRAHPGALV